MTIKPKVFLSSDDQSEKQISKQETNIFFHFNNQAWPAHSHVLLKKPAGGQLIVCAVRCRYPNKVRCSDR